MELKVAEHVSQNSFQHFRLGPMPEEENQFEPATKVEIAQTMLSPSCRSRRFSMFTVIALRDGSPEALTCARRKSAKMTVSELMRN
jgi:hypothetical protein